MSNIKKIRSVIINGKELLVYRIENSSGAYVDLLNYEATIMSVVVPDRYNKRANVVLSYDDISLYINDKYYLGSTIGRYANRISKAKFNLNNKTYYLDKNDGLNSNHGGFRGLHSHLFDTQIINDKLIFSTISKDGEGGFPGTLNIKIQYTFSDENNLLIRYIMQSDKPTPANLTNHAYFNLTGEKQSALNHQLQINGEEYLQTGNDFLPTGKVLKIADTAFDFTEFRTVNEMINKKNDLLEGYNTYFVKTSQNKDIPIASLRCKLKGRLLNIYSSMTGVLFYTGDFLNNEFLPFQGVCLEAHYHPDGVNNPHFSTCILKPLQEQEEWIEYSFQIFD